jgi:hypothetical protein
VNTKRLYVGDEHDLDLEECGCCLRMFDDDEQLQGMFDEEGEFTCEECFGLDHDPCPLRSTQ